MRIRIDNQTLRDVMTTDLATVDPEATLREVVDVLAARGVSGAPVVTSDGKLVGVISNSDIVDFMASTPPVPLEPADFDEAVEELRSELAIEDAGNEEEGGSEFYRELWANADTDVVERFAEQNGPEWDLLTQYTASSIMTRKLESLPSCASVTQAARKLLDRGVHRILIVDDGKLQGVVSTLDLIRLIADDPGWPKTAALQADLCEVGGRYDYW